MSTVEELDGHFREVAGPPLLQQQREEIDLEEQVAELVEQLRVVGRKCGVGDLVRLLDGVRDDRLRRLLAIPRALPAQALGQRLKFEEGPRERALPIGQVSQS